MDGLVNYGLLRPENVNAFQTGLIQGEDRRNALAQQQQQRQLTDIQLQNALREQRMAGEEEAAYKAAGSDLNRLQAELMQRGLGKQGLAVGAQLQQQRTAKLTELKATAEVLKREASAVVAEPTIANAVGRLQAFSKATGADVSADLQQVMALGENPEAIRRWAAGHAMEADKLLPKFERFDQGSAVVTGAVNPLTGEFRELGRTAKTATPGELLTDARARERLQMDTKTLSPDENALVSRAILEGRLDPNRVNSRNVKIIASTLATQPDADLRGLSLTATTDTAASRTLGTISANVVTAANEAEKMIPIAQEYIAKIQPSNYPLVNQAGLFVAKNTGDPNQAGLAASLNALVNTYARAINPRGVPTVSDKNHAREVIHNAMSQGQFAEVFNVMQQEMQASQAAPKEARSKLFSKETKTELTGENKTAYDWAKSNPSDPRSAKILEKLGVK